MEVTFKQVTFFVWSYFKRFPIQVTLAYVAMSFNVIAELLNPLATGWLVDSVAKAGVITQEAFHQAFFYVLLMVGQGILYHVSARSAHFLNCYTDAHVERLIAAETLDKVQRFSTDWHVNTFGGSVVTKIRRAMRAAHTFYDIFCYDIFPTTTITIGMIILISFRNITLGMIFMVFSLMYSFISIFIATHYIAPQQRKANKEDNRLGAALADTITSNATVKSFAGESYENHFFDRISFSWMQSTRTTWVRENQVALIQSALMNLLKFLVMGGAVWFWYKGKFSPGDVVFIFSSYQLWGGYLRTIGDRVRELNQAVNDLEDVVQFSLKKQEVQDLSQQVIRVQKGEIYFDSVYFQYPKQAEAIYKNFSLTIHPGEKVALVGPSGGGKSTIVKLVQRLYDVQQGAIFIDKQNIAQVTQESLRKNIALVPQEPILFHRTLAENIAYGRPEASLQEIIEASKKAHAHEFIAHLASGYDTLVGERGIKLSGGERQRIAIARALLANRPILILDEATSSLDSESEKLIQNALHILMQGRTSLIIAHRLSTIKSADRILVFDRGNIIEEGTHEELLQKKNGRYTSLWEHQVGGFIEL